MAQCNNVIDVVGPEVGIKDISYDSGTNTITITYDDDHAKDIILNDKFLSSVALSGKMLILTMDDGTTYTQDLSTIETLTSLSKTSHVMMYKDEHNNISTIDFSEYDHTNKYIPIGEKAQPMGVATLNGNGKLMSSQVPPLSISEIYTVDTLADRNSLNSTLAAPNGGIHRGDVAIVKDDSTTWIANADGGLVDEQWTPITVPGAPVLSVNGEVGVVELASDDIPEGTINKYYTNSRVISVIQATNIGALADVDTDVITPVDGAVLKYNGSIWVPSTDDILEIRDDLGLGATSSVWSADKIQKEINALASISTSFTGLTDTPNVYGASANFAVKVNNDATGLEFVDDSVIYGGTY